MSQVANLVGLPIGVADGPFNDRNEGRMCGLVIRKSRSQFFGMDGALTFELQQAFVGAGEPVVN
jgi:hypothetical protein